MTVFCASVNDRAYLVDPTGNTRFWTIPVTSINYTHDIDMQQVFAQALVLLEQGEQWWLTAAEEAALEAVNLQYRAVNVVRDLILDFVQVDPLSPQVERMTAVELLRRIGIDRPTNAQCKDANSVLRELEPRIGPPTRSRGKVRWPIPMRLIINDDF
jgi:predicted P-loop ATPase